MSSGWLAAALRPFETSRELSATHCKKFHDWSRLNTSEEYLLALNIDSGIPVSDLVTVSANAIGGTGTTWAHPLVAIEVARWISPAFGVWCNKHIKTLIETGTTSTTSITSKEDQDREWLRFGYSLVEQAI